MTRPRLKMVPATSASKAPWKPRAKEMRTAMAKSASSTSSPCSTLSAPTANKLWMIDLVKKRPPERNGPFFARTARTFGTWSSSNSTRAATISSPSTCGSGKGSGGPPPNRWRAGATADTGSAPTACCSASRARGADFHLTFLNPDGSEAFCGNGARAAFTWWRMLTEGQFNDARFTAVDGAHEGHWVEGEPCVDLHLKAEPQDTRTARLSTPAPHLVVGMTTEHLVDLNRPKWPPRCATTKTSRRWGSTSTSWPPLPMPMAGLPCGPSRGRGGAKSCGGGTVAAAAVLRWANGGDAFQFQAPGGRWASSSRAAARAWLSGPVEMPFSGRILPGEGCTSSSFPSCSSVGPAAWWPKASVSSGPRRRPAPFPMRPRPGVLTCTRGHRAVQRLWPHRHPHHRLGG